MNKIINKLRTLPSDNEIRKTYEPLFDTVQKEFESAKKAKENMLANISTEKMKLADLKLNNDIFREKIYGKLIGLLSKKEADRLMH